MTLYILLDDESHTGGTAATLAQELQEAGHGLQVEALMPTSDPGDLLERLSAPTSGSGSSRSGCAVEGLLLDIRLDQVPPNTSRPHFNGLTVAQEIRTQQTLGRLHHIPLVRFSQPAIVDKYVGNDTTSLDLFDAIILKGEVVEQADRVALLLVDLSRGYKTIRNLDVPNGEEWLSALLALDTSHVLRLDERLLIQLAAAGRLTHEVARYLLRRLLERPGVLVDEGTLAIRLGVDMERSADWAMLRAELEQKCGYTGPFGESHARWWWMLVEDWWLDDIGEQRPLRSLSAQQRMRSLMNGRDFSLAPIQSPSGSRGERFWMPCARTGEPVDPRYGFALAPLPRDDVWMDVEYLSHRAGLRFERTETRLRRRDREKIRALKAASRLAGGADGE